MQQNAAYNLSTFAPHPVRERQELRVAKPETEKKNILKRIGYARLKTIALISVLVTLATGVLLSQTQVTELSGAIATGQSDLADLQSEYTYLVNEIEMKTNMKLVETYATSQLGLVKLDKSQIVYVSTQTENRVERTAGAGEQILNSIEQGVTSFQEYLTP